MSLEKVNEEIKEQAQHRVKEILYAAKQAAKEIKQAADEEVKKLEHIAVQQEEEAKAQLSLKEQVAINLEAKKLLFEAKKEMLDETFAKAKTRVNNMDRKKKEELIKLLIKKASKELQIAVIYSNAQDAKVLEKQGNYQIKVIPDIKAGFIAENAAATIRLDYTFTTLFERVKEQALQKVAAIIG